MSGCEKILQGIWEYLDQEMSPDNVKEIQKHLDLCRACYSRVEFEKILREHMRAKTNRTCPERLKKRIQDIIELY